MSDKGIYPTRIPVQITQQLDSPSANFSDNLPTLHNITSLLVNAMIREGRNSLYYLAISIPLYIVIVSVTSVCLSVCRYFLKPLSPKSPCICRTSCLYADTLSPLNVLELKIFQKNIGHIYTLIVSSMMQW